ncbi:MAG: hypothetical protein IPL43_06090 [Micropruina sp.]|nr:hypothetical protein [Micropruina sp.]
MVEAVVEVDKTLASHVGRILDDGEFVGPGREISMGFTEEQARDAGTEPLVLLTPPTPTSFVISVIVRQLVTAGVSLEDGMLATLVGVGKCYDKVKAIDGLPGTLGAVQECLSGGSEAVAKALATTLVKAGRDPHWAGQVAGKLVGRVVSYLALIGPAWTILNWTADSLLLEAALAVHVAVRPSPALTWAALRSARVPSLCDHLPGKLKDGVLQGDGTNGNVSLVRELSKLGPVVPGQPNGAAAVFNCSQGGVGWPDYVLFYDNKADLIGSFNTADIGAMAGRQTVTGITIGASAVEVTIEAVPLRGDNEMWGSSVARATFNWSPTKSAMVRESLRIATPDAVARSLAEALQRRDRAAAIALAPRLTVDEMMPQDRSRVEFDRCIGAHDDTFGHYLRVDQRGCLIDYVYANDVESHYSVHMDVMERAGFTWKVVAGIGVAG